MRNLLRSTNRILFFTALLCSIGCSSYRVQSLHYLNNVETAEVIERDLVVTVIELSEIRPYLLRATWTSKRLHNKGGHRLRIKGDTYITVSYYGSCFWVKDQPGSYLIRPEDSDEFDDFFSQLLKEKIIPWRAERNQEAANR
jgi:hypothetical protein